MCFWDGAGWEWEGGEVGETRVWACAIKQVTASLRWFFWCLRFRQGVLRCWRELWAGKKNRRKERDSACVNTHTCCRVEKALKARWEFLMSVTSQAQTTGLREHYAHLSHTGLEWRQPPTPSHSSTFFSPLHHVCVGRRWLWLSLEVLFFSWVCGW